MAICRRDKCCNPVGGDSLEKALRLCTPHYIVKCQLALKRQKQASAVCQYINCGKLLAGSRNKRYCSTLCRTRAKRIFDDDLMVQLQKHPHWLNAESMIKSNPLGLASIRSIKDIVALVSLYQLKACHQRAYNMLNGEWVVSSAGAHLKRLRPWFELELAHRYPNARGGANTPTNIVIVPKLISRMLKDRIPIIKHGSAYNGIQARSDAVPVKKTLMNALVSQYGSEVVYEELGVIKNQHIIDTARPYALRRKPGFQPVLSLLLQETLRLGMSALRTGIKQVASATGICPDTIDSELFAIACFHALLNGDADDFINGVIALYGYWSEPQKVPVELKGKELHQWFTGLFRHYMLEHFGLDMLSLGKRIAFYKSLFTDSPVTESGMFIV